MTFLFYWSVFAILNFVLAAKGKVHFTINKENSFSVWLLASFVEAVPFTFIHLFIAHFF